MLISADDDPAPACQRAGKELVIVGIFTNGFLKFDRLIHFCMFNDKFQNWIQVNLRTRLRQNFSDPTIFIQNFL